MPRYLKDVLYKGKWHPKSGAVKFTDAHLSHLAQRGNDMLAAGLEIPLVKEHLDGAIPMSRNAALKSLCDGVLGWTKKFVVDQGILKAEVEANDDDAGKKIEGLRFASPELLHNWKDGKGKEWADMSITHIAATPFPVQYPQQPFQRLSRIRLAREDYEDDDADDDDDDSDPLDIDGDGDSDTDTSDDDSGKGGKGDNDKPEADPEAPRKLKEIQQALAACKIVIPEDTTPANFVDRLHAAVLTYQAATGTGNQQQQQQGEPEMATDQALQFSALKTKVEQLEKDNAALLQKGFTADKAALRRRANALVSPVRRISDKAHAAIVKKLDAIQFSATAGSSPLRDAEAMIENYELLDPLPDPKAAFVGVGVGGTQLSNAEVVEPPVEDGHETAEQRAKRLKESAEELAKKYSRAPRK